MVSKVKNPGLVVNIFDWEDLDLCIDLVCPFFEADPIFNTTKCWTVTYDWISRFSYLVQEFFLASTFFTSLMTRSRSMFNIWKDMVLAESDREMVQDWAQIIEGVHILYHMRNKRTFARPIGQASSLRDSKRLCIAVIDCHKWRPSCLCADNYCVAIPCCKIFTCRRSSFLPTRASCLLCSL